VASLEDREKHSREPSLSIGEVFPSIAHISRAFSGIAGSKRSARALTRTRQSLMTWVAASLSVLIDFQGALV